MLLSSTTLLHAQGILYFVNTTNDTVVIGACENGDAGCSLRGAIGTANAHVGADGITFDLPAGAVINLTQALPNVTESVDISGPGADKLTVRRDTGGDYRIFNVTTTATVAFSGMTISNGRMLGAGGGFGGGIANSNTGTVNVINCTVSGNFASAVGGGIYQGSGTLNIINSTLSGNSAQDGGGIGNGSFGTLTVTNSTLSGNFASGAKAGGGGIFNTGTLSVSNCTISGNQAGYAGGVFNNGTTNVKSSIIALNMAPLGPDVGNNNNTVSHGFNLIGKNDGAATSFPAGNPNANDDIVGTSASPVNPQLDPNGLQNNGGPTQTIALLPESPAIDKGTSNGLTGSLTTDQRGTGFARTLDDEAVSNTADGTDIGAFELRPPVPLVSVASRKVHGATVFNINLPRSGAIGIECRTGGENGDYKLVFSFATTLASVDDASVTSGAGSVSSHTIGINTHNYIVNLIGVSNVQVIRVSLTNVTDSAGNHSSSVPISLGVLIGDTTGNGTVNSSDIGQTKSRSGQTATAANFRSDVTVSGSINSSDIGLVKSKAGTVLP